ncbi:MAG: hypothetical protein SVT56_03300, partial [Chloroflexota bacterium]|nr:hypothetical protein [Chloroflexota bacterium]
KKSAPGASINEIMNDTLGCFVKLLMDKESRLCGKFSQRLYDLFAIQSRMAKDNRVILNM